MDAPRKNLFSISFSQFGNAFSSNFVQVFFPFYILKISPYPMQYTLLWIGATMGVTGLCAAITSPFWGSLTHRLNPKLLYLRALLVNVVSFFLMGFTTDIHLLFVLRVIQGLATGTSTIGFIIVSSSSPKERVSSNIGIFHNSLTLGQLLGPLLGSLAAATFGYRGSFIAASCVVFSSFVFAYLYVMNIPPLPKTERTSGRTAIDRRILVGGFLCFSAIVQITFLPSVLPNVFEAFQYEHATALRLAGTVVLCYTATAMIGIFIWTRVAWRIGINRMITILFTLGILLQAMLAFSHGIVDFTIVRMLQTGFVAATFPLILSVFASESKGSTIGFLNATRFAGNAVGPMLATSILAYTNLPTVYFFISGITLLAFLGFKAFFTSSSPRPEDLSEGTGGRPS
jgi:DHA1 family multidrug resistance protein-like MFS transporter